MRDSIVLDTSVIAAIYFTDPYSDWAEDIVRSYRKCYTVDIAYAEIGNVAWKRIYLFKHPRREILEGLRNAIQFISNICFVVESKSILENAISIALDAEIAVYDALFVYLAIINDIPLATLDKKLINAIKDKQYSRLLLHPY